MSERLMNEVNALVVPIIQIVENVSVKNKQWDYFSVFPQRKIQCRIVLQTQVSSQPANSYVIMDYVSAGSDQN